MSRQQFVRIMIIFTIATTVFNQVLYLTNNPPQSAGAVTKIPLNRSIQGVWLTNVDSDVLLSSSKLASAVTTLKHLRFNQVYPCVWNRGYTLYPSSVAKNTIGHSVDPTPKASGLRNRNMLAELAHWGNQANIKVIPWFEYGFMTPADSELADRHPHWITQKQNGDKIWVVSGKKQVWLNPLHSEVQDFILSLLTEIVSQPQVDGIQLDDHFSLPSEFGYDRYTLALYQRENPEKPVPTPTDHHWVRWRANKLTEFMARVYKTLKAQNPNLIISVSPNTYEYAYSKQLQDWSRWVEQGWIDELVVQVYFNEESRFKQEIENRWIQQARKKIPVSIGILAGLRTQTVPITQIARQISVVQERKFSGLSFFFYESLWSLNSKSPNQRKTALSKVLQSFH
ncbi:glycoside hydrolase family 10 protein [Leptolyngbya sp. AN03gr2]|uniref:glycoside hydrolase family 10 protein n=1 Tax=unclassified Leptolyngbya TaxID=2650499 RepID=UPI003D31D954